MSRRRQRDSALLAALFLIVVVAALGLYAMRLGINQQQAASLELLQFRAHAAANAGLEFWANRISNNNAVPCGTTAPAFEGFSLTVTCTRTDTGLAVVYELTCTARRGTYGTAEFVQREATRRVTTMGTGYWSR